MLSCVLLVVVWKMKTTSIVSIFQGLVAQFRIHSAGTTTNRASVRLTAATSVLRSPTVAGGTTSAFMPT